MRNGGVIMKDVKLEVVPQHTNKLCYFCDGLGFNLKKIIQTKTNAQFEVIPCKRCEGTGIYVQKFYHMIYTDKNGQKMAFGTDTIK